MYIFPDGDNRDIMYKSTHVNHPCSVWVRQCKANYIWLYGLFVNLCEEYTYRYNKIHLCESKLKAVLRQPPTNIPDSMVKTVHPQAMPDKYRNEDAVIAYRQYYIGDKVGIASWKNRDKPEWFD